MIAHRIALSGFPQLFARLWVAAPGALRGVILLVHGLGDHGGRYRRFAQRMTRRGWAVLAVDLPGHGRSGGRRGTARSYDEVLRVIAACRVAAQAAMPGAPQVVLGHSMGGNFAVNFALRREEFECPGRAPIAALVLLAPMLMPPHRLDRAQIFAAWGAGQLLRWVRVSKPARVEQLTRHSGGGDPRGSDPLQHQQVSLYLATQLLAQGRFALDHAAGIAVPTLVVHGEDDDLVDRAACRNLVLRIRGAAQGVCWPGGRHDLANDVDADHFADHLHAWLRPRVEPAASGVPLAA